MTVKRRLNLFAAAGRVNYGNSARLYLQSMDALPEQHPWLHQCFQEKGYHAVKRNEKYWAGLWSELVIEQLPMRLIKSRGGLSRERGIDENTITMWIHSVHHLVGIRSSLTGQIHETNEQHVQQRESRIKQDLVDLATLQDWFEDHSPFNNFTELISIANEVTASEELQVNCDEA